MNPDYVLRGAEEGAKRLALLSRVKWPTTQRLLLQLGLRVGMHLLVKSITVFVHFVQRDIEFFVDLFATQALERKHEDAPFLA